MIRTLTDELNNEAYYFDTRRQWVEPEDIAEPEDDDFLREDESE